jgi:hypothetical protein
MSFSLDVVGDDLLLEAVQRYGEGARWLSGLRGSAIGASAPYAGYVHEGTSRMPARPFLSNAIQRNAPALRTKLLTAIPQGEQATARAMLWGSNEILEAARAEAPVRTGYLRSSLYVRIRGA